MSSQSSRPLRSERNDFLRRFPLESTALLARPRPLLVLYLFLCRQRTLLKVEATAAAREMLLPQFLSFKQSGGPRRGKSDSTPDNPVPSLLWIEQTTLR